MAGKGLTDHLSSRLPAGGCGTLFPGDGKVQSLEDIRGNTTLKLGWTL